MRRCQRQYKFEEKQQTLNDLKNKFMEVREDIKQRKAVQMRRQQEAKEETQKRKKKSLIHIFIEDYEIADEPFLEKNLDERRRTHCFGAPFQTCALIHISKERESSKDDGTLSKHKICS